MNELPEQPTMNELPEPVIETLKTFGVTLKDVFNAHERAGAWRIVTKDAKKFVIRADGVSVDPPPQVDLSVVPKGEPPTPPILPVEGVLTELRARSTRRRKNLT